MLQNASNNKRRRKQGRRQVFAPVSNAGWAVDPRGDDTSNVITVRVR